MRLLCVVRMWQIALDGVKLLEKGSSRVLRVYPLETITCWAVRNQPRGR